MSAASPYSSFTSLPELLEYRASSSPDQVAVRVHTVPSTYAELWERSGRVQAWLTAAGVRRGDNVTLLMRNSTEFLDAWFGLARLGAVAVPVNTASVGEALRHTIAHSESVGIIADADLLAAVDAVSDGLNLRWRVALGDAPTNEVNFAELLDPHLVAPSPIRPDPLDPMNIIYTSGTTGMPKGVVLPYLSYVNTGGYFAHHLGLVESDVLHTCLPLFHCNAQQTTLMSGLTLGAEVVIDRSFSLSRFWSWIGRSNATVTNLLGSMIALLDKRIRPTRNVASTCATSSRPRFPSICTDRSRRASTSGSSRDTACPRRGPWPVSIHPTSGDPARSGCRWSTTNCGSSTSTGSTLRPATSARF